MTPLLPSAKVGSYPLRNGASRGVDRWVFRSRNHPIRYPRQFEAPVSKPTKKVGCVSWCWQKYSAWCLHLAEVSQWPRSLPFSSSRLPILLLEMADFMENKKMSRSFWKARTLFVVLLCARWTSNAKYSRRRAARRGKIAEWRYRV